MTIGMEDSDPVYEALLAEYTTLGSFSPMDDIPVNHSQRVSPIVPAQEEVVVGILALGPVEDSAFDMVPSSDTVPTSSTHTSPGSGQLLSPITGPVAGPASVTPIPQGAMTFSTSPVGTTGISKMRNKAIIVELKNDYLVPSWVLEGKRIQRQMLRDPVLAKRKLEEKKKFVKGHEPMSRGNLIRLLEQCREGPKRDMSIGTLQGILTDLGLFTDEQWSLFNREMKAGLIPRRKPR